MNGNNIYPVIYNVIKKHTLSTQPSKGYERFWEFARILPHYSKVTNEQADALCTSVSHCKQIGLQGFYQVRVSWDDVVDLIMNDKIEVSAPDMLEYRGFFYEGGEESNVVLGDFVRRFFDGRKVLNENDERILDQISITESR